MQSTLDSGDTVVWLHLYDDITVYLFAHFRRSR